MKKRGVLGSRGQVAMEYMMVIGFAMLLLIPTLILYVSESQNVKADIAVAQAAKIARILADKAEEVYYMGEPSMTTVKMNIPEGVKSLNFSYREVSVFFQRSNGFTNEITDTTPINLTGSFETEPGLYYIQIKSMGDYVLISKT